jgi:hypothetical protein
MAVSFIGGGNQNATRKTLTCCTKVDHAKQDLSS